MAAVDFTNPEAAEYVKDRIRKLMELGVGVMKTDFPRRYRRALFS